MWDPNPVRLLPFEEEEDTPEVAFSLSLQVQRKGHVKT